MSIANSPLKRAAEMSPCAKARMAGIFEALEGVASSQGQVFILGKFVIAGGAAATAANVFGHERFYWLGFGISLAGVAFHVAWVALFYELFEIVNRSLSLVSAFVGLVTCGLQALTAFLYLAPLLILQSGNAVGALTTAQLQDLALIFFKLNSCAFDVDLVFFGAWCALAGYLILKSEFMPRILGALLMIDGVGWMMFAHPPLALRIFPLIAAASGLAEIPMQLWLIIMGVNAEKWRQQASAAAE